MRNKSKIIILLIIFLICLLGLLIFNRKSISTSIYNISNKLEKVFEKKINIYIEINDNNKVLIGNECNIKFKIKNTKENIKVLIFANEVNMDEFFMSSSEMQYNITLENNGKNDIKIEIFDDIGESIYSENTEIYVISQYEKQFAEKISTFGISTHFGLNYNRDEIEKSNELLYNLGVKNIRDTILWEHIKANENAYDYTIPNLWIPYMQKNDINILASIGGGTKKQVGEDLQISNSKELDEYGDYIDNVFKMYPYIKEYQVFNEPNGKWVSEEQKKWYAQSVILTNKILQKGKIDNAKVISGAVAIQHLKEKESIDYLNDIIIKYNALKYSNVLSYHIYTSQDNMERLKKVNEYSWQIVNQAGGFIDRYIGEFGINISENLNEVERGAKIIKQYLTSLENGIKKCYLYVFRDTSDINGTSRYGLLNNDYTPKESYFIIKEFLQNTNGAEYIGTVNIAEGLETHVYDKDGKPVIITWSENSTNNIQIDYKDFTAKDLYGKDIQPDENGKLTITTSPVYLCDVDYNYFYKAISNIAISKYDEFKEKFATEISQISGFEEKINQRQNYSQSVANTQKLMQNTAITAMKSHYELGDIILKAYEEGQLKAEPVKISSMLDMINDIGNSYEDLVTVSVNNTINSVMKTLDEANVDSSELVTTKQKIDETENLINTNTDVEIIYPTKILQFSKDCYEKADYINSLEEQNDIKAGLIISNNLHAQLLADWANKFASIQINNNINEYIAQNPVTIEYSETNITNKSVKASIKTNAQIQITNNSNSKEYVFDQNGSFTFEYTIKGQAKQITAKVTNIDKISPIVNGVEEGKVYTSKVTPTITDENLDTIELTLNGEKIKNFKSGTTLTEEGFYVLTATDKAGNKTQISFQIMENNNQNYIIEKNTIKNISAQTKKSDFDNKVKLGITYKITRNDVEITNEDNIATGDILTTSAGDQYTLIVTGDINKDGKLNLKDFVRMRLYLLDENELDENEKIAADCNLDGKISLKDFVRMRLMILMQDVAN